MLEAADDAASTFLTFDLDGQTFAVAVQRVREILDTQPVTRLPNAPHEIRGVIDVRGSSVPIVELTASLGMGSMAEGTDTRVVVFEIEQPGGKPRPVGVIADRVRDVCRIEPEEIEAPPDLGIGRVNSHVILGLCRRDDALVVLVDLACLFADQSIDLVG